MRRRTLLSAAAAATVGLAGCSGSNSDGGGGGSGSGIDVQVTCVGDAIGDFDSLTFDVEYVGIDPSTGDAGKLHAGTDVDLTSVTGGASKSVLVISFPFETYESLSLRGSVDDGSVSVAGNGSLRYGRSFDLKKGKTTVYVAAVRLREKGDGYVLEAAPDQSSVSFRDGVPEKQ